MLAGLDTFPAYYKHMGPANEQGARPIDLSPAEHADPEELRRRIQAGEWVVDLRQRRLWAAEHLAGSLSFDVEGNAITYLGWLIPWGTPVTLLGATQEQITDFQRSLTRIGIDRPAGQNVGEPRTWATEPSDLGTVRRVDFPDLVTVLAEDPARILIDARRRTEWQEGHIEGARHLPLHDFPDQHRPAQGLVGRGRARRGRPDDLDLLRQRLPGHRRRLAAGPCRDPRGGRGRPLPQGRGSRTSHRPRQPRRHARRRLRRLAAHRDPACAPDVNLLAFLAIGIALGMALGLFGGGGGILAIPLLVAAGLPADEAGTTSLIVVGIGAIGGLIPHARAGRVAWAQGATFGALGIIGALAGSTLALATNDAVQLWGFSVVLVVAGTLMMRKALRDPPSASRPEPDRPRRSWALIVVTAAAVGLFTGFFGVGGGFLVVPALALVMGMSMHRATATALLVIVINSAAALPPPRRGGPGRPGRRHRGSQRPGDRRARGPVVEQMVGESHSGSASPSWYSPCRS